MKAPPTQAQLVNALATERLLPFVMLVFAMLNPDKPPLKPSWYLRAMCHWLERVERGELLRSMIWLQPRALKSITAAVAFPCWLLGRDPSMKIIVATYGGELSRQHAEHRRAVLESEWYRRLFPQTVIAENRQMEVTTTRHGRCLSVSVGGRFTGSGADLLIFDDLMKAEDAMSEVARASMKRWIDSTASTRLDPLGRNAILSIQQRLHEDDPCAYLRDKGYACLSLPAIAPHDMEVEIGPGLTHLYRRGELLCPELINAEQLEQKRLELGNQVFSAQYLQDPIPPGAGIVRRDWISYYDEAPEREELLGLVQSWDIATKAGPDSAYTVCTTWGFHIHRWLLLDVFRMRIEFPDLLKAIPRLKQEWRADKVLIEDASHGEALRSHFRAHTRLRPIMCRATVGKEERLIGQTGQIEAGRVAFPESAPWLADYLHELFAAPHCRYWDQVDSTVQFLQYMISRRGRAFEERDPKTGRKMSVFRRDRVERRDR